MSITVLLADDHQLVREGLRALLDKDPAVVIVAEAMDGLTAVQLACELKPDVVLMDIAMPLLNGIEATRRITSEVPGTKVVALSMHGHMHVVLEMLRAGASGYLLKDCASEALFEAIRTVHANLTFLSPQIADSVLDSYVHQQAGPEADAVPRLSPRESEVLKLITCGKSTREIAESLGLSSKTIETHRRQIMRKFDVSSVAELTKCAIRAGLARVDT